MEEKLEKIYVMKYAKLYGAIDEFVSQKKLALVGLLPLSCKFKKKRMYGPNYQYNIVTQNPLLIAHELVNELAVKVPQHDFTLNTIEPYNSFSIIINPYFFSIVTIKYSPFWNPTKLNLLFTYWELSNLENDSMWEELLQYEKLLRQEKLPVTQFSKKKINIDLSTFSNKVVLGEMAYYLQNQSLLVQNSKPIITALAYNVNGNKKFNEFLKCEYIEFPEYTVIVHDLLQYMPVCIFKTINGINIAHPNIILYFLIYYNQYQYYNQYDASAMPCDDQQYIGTYQNLAIVRKQRHILGNVKLFSYNPKKYFEENGKYKLITLPR